MRLLAGTGWGGRPGAADGAAPVSEPPAAGAPPGLAEAPTWARPVLLTLARLRAPRTVVAVAMSGGVDSSVAAALLVAAGVGVVGVTMRLWGEEELERGEGGCCSLDAVEDARRVCGRLGIAHYVLNLREHFHSTVVGDFLSQYRDGLTPNPCVRCNERVKFDELYRRVRLVGASHLATGHYCRLTEAGDGSLVMRRARDQRKDQSYTLYRTPDAVLRRCVFPLGELEKPQVRELARTWGLAVATKPDSQELCFVGGGDHRGVLARDLAGSYAPGPILDLEGREVGRHQGVPFYTVGQRHGLELKVTRPDAEPQYVVKVESRANTVRIGPWRALLTPSCSLSRLVVLSPRPAGEGANALAQLRAHGRPVPALWWQLPGGRARVEFREPQAGVSPGQSLVLYDGDQVVAGGEVEVESGAEAR